MSNIINIPSNPQFSGGFSKNNANSGFTASLQSLQECFGKRNLNYISDINQILKHTQLAEAYVETLTEDYARDVESTDFVKTSLNENSFDAFMTLCENARIQLLDEAYMGDLKPITGLTMPLLKLYWMKNIFKDVVPTVTSPNNQPAWQLGLEKRWIQFENDGPKYYLPEAFDDPNFDISGQSKVRVPDTAIAVPALDHDLIAMVTGASRKNDDRISTDLYISEVTYSSGEGDQAKDVTVQTRIKPDLGTGLFAYDVIENKVRVDRLTGGVDYDKSTMDLSSATGKVKSIKINASLSSENHLRTPRVGWNKDTKYFNIPDAAHLATGVTEEQLRDERAIYNVDGAAKIVEMMQDVLGVIKDKHILNFLDNSKTRIAGSDQFISTKFDCRPPQQIQNMTHTEWVRVELKETLDKLAQKLSEILKDQTITISVVGNPTDIRTLADITTVQGNAAEVGGCKLGYKIGLYNNQRNFIVTSSERIPEGKLRIYVFPNSEDHMTYKVFEYQFIISNQYRDANNGRIPSVMVSERFLIDEFTPIQGEINILNNMMSSSDVFGTPNPPSSK